MCYDEVCKMAELWAKEKFPCFNLTIDSSEEEFNESSHLMMSHYHPETGYFMLSLHIPLDSIVDFQLENDTTK